MAHGRDGGERACRRRRSDTRSQIRAAWPVAERQRGAVSAGAGADIAKKRESRDGINLLSGKYEIKYVSGHLQVLRVRPATSRSAAAHATNTGWGDNLRPK